MLRDVFYYGKKPNVHPREQYAVNLEDARSKATTRDFWIINEFCDYRNFDWDFDFDFLPDEDVWAEDHNNVWPSQHQKDSGTWLCPKEYSDIVIYRGDVDPVIRKNEITDNWVELDRIDHTKFDFSWHPDPTDPPYIYKWGCKFYPAQLRHVLEYRVPGATEEKYMPNTVELLSQTEYWVEHQEIDKHKFDMSWRPDPRDPPYIYVWGNRHIDGRLKPTLEYHTPGAVDKKYMPELLDVVPQYDRWTEHVPVDKAKFDFSWRPDPREPAYIYVWGNQHNNAVSEPTVTYTVEGATEYKYVTDTVAYVLPDMDRWTINYPVVKSSFDFSWRPSPFDPPYIYRFGSTQYPAQIMPVLEYAVPGAIAYKYMDITVKLDVNMDNWVIPEGIDVSTFDFSWYPDPKSPPYVYQFGTTIDNHDGPRYVVPDNIGEVVYLKRVEKAKDDVEVKQYYIKTTLDDLVKEHPNEVFWALRKNIDYSHFDFEWRPSTVEVAWELNYVHVFGAQESELTQTYFVSGKHYLNGNRDFKFVETKSLEETNLANIFVKPDMFFIDRGNQHSNERYEALKAKFGTRIQKTRYLSSWVDTINRCTARSTTDLFWVLNSELDYTDFNFDYYPNPWQMKMVQVFGTQWSHWGTTFMVNRETFAEDTKYINVIEHLSNLNFVKNIRAKATQCVYDVILIDHGNPELQSVAEQIEHKIKDKTLHVVKYDMSYLDTLKDFISKLPESKEHYVWVCSSICDYKNFDFSYIVDPFSRESLHVFPSGSQKFGDTFFINVNHMKKIFELLKDFESHPSIKFNNDQVTQRLPEPIIYTEDTHVDAIHQIKNFPYATIISMDNKDIEESDCPPINMWSNSTKNIIIESTGATRIVVPNEAKLHVKSELYDYPYIKRAPKLVKSNPIDIVFLSNGEAGAEENYEHLLKVAENLPNRVVRVDGVNGRVAAYHAAAEASNTPWMFTVFAKLKVNPKFDWSWQPDRMQVPKHYIFHAKNPVNGLTYGHQAMIAYNKKLTLANEGKGLDFTLDDAHEVVPLISGTVHYNTDPYSTWRTSFRETLKLIQATDDDSKERLDAWLNKAEGDFAEYSIKGARDAEVYFNEVNGDFDKLKLSYEWAWLRKRFEGND